MQLRTTRASIRADAMMICDIVGRCNLATTSVAWVNRRIAWHQDSNLEVLQVVTASNQRTLSKLHARACGWPIFLFLQTEVLWTCWIVLHCLVKVLVKEYFFGTPATLWKWKFRSVKTFAAVLYCIGLGSTVHIHTALCSVELVLVHDCRLFPSVAILFVDWQHNFLNWPQP